MFKKARLKLTLFYSLAFLSFFWLADAALYLLVSQALGGDPALLKFRDALLLLNVTLIFIVPFLAWFFTSLALQPVQEIHETQKTFVSDVSHELRTPLSILGNEIEVALRKNRSTTFYKQVLVSNKQEIERLSALVDNLLFLARDGGEGQKAALESVDITDVAGGVINLLKDKAVAKRIRLSLQPAKEPVAVWGQPLLLKQLLLNIIDNAINYTPSGGSVEVNLGTRGRSAQIRVKDSGIGIAKQERAQIFNRFYRAGSTRSRINGYGLGLTISQSIARLHRGEIRVDSRLGKGSVFTIVLPRALG